MDRIAVTGVDDSISSQARTYAEYRVFAAVARHIERVRRIRVVMHPSAARGPWERVTCAITVDFEPSGALRIRATGPHAYASINRAVERLVAAMGAR